MTEKKRKTAPMVFKGIERDAKDKKAYCWLTLDDPEKQIDTQDFGRRCVYKKQIQKGATPGAVYEILLGDEEGVVMINGGAYQGRYPDEDQVVKWQALHHATKQSLDENGKTARELKERLDLRRLEPFRCA